MGNKITIYGGGLIGSGWAASFVLGGAEVTVFDINDDCLEGTKRRIRGMLENMSHAAPALITAERVESCLSGIRYTTDPEQAVRDAELIQENGPERLEIKQSMVAEIEKYNHTAVIASSTSGQKVTDIAANAAHPERIVAGHPFNPVNLMPLVEICGGEKTAPEAIERAKEIYTAIGKVPVVLRKECKGFIGNRLQAALNREVQDLVARDVCSVEEIDKAVVFGLGLRLGLIGPHMVFELAGGDGGIATCLTKFEVSKETLDDLASWDVRPAAYYEMAVKGANEEIAAREPAQGNTHAGLEAFRDEGIMRLLEYHGLSKKWEK